ncbi:MAG: hypothetical protein ABJZ55_06940 [Fuerstiella sp.]
MKWIASVAFLAVAAFCLFGFLATFEPTSNQMYFRVGYAVTGTFCLACVGYMLSARNKI